jgi:rhodanese-related sulfurtransferase
MPVKIIDVATLKTWIEAGEAVVIDVRELDEYMSGHIAGALHIPLGELAQKLDDVEVPDDKKLVMQCRSGGRSMKACDISDAFYPTRDVYNLKGGILDWEAQGFEVLVP